MFNRRVMAHDHVWLCALILATVPVPRKWRLWIYDQVRWAQSLWLRALFLRVLPYVQHASVSDFHKPFRGHHHWRIPWAIEPISATYPELFDRGVHRHLGRVWPTCYGLHLNYRPRIAYYTAGEVKRRSKVDHPAREDVGQWNHAA